MLISTAFASCTNESEDIQPLQSHQGTNLDIQVGIDKSIVSRALITGQNLIDGSRVGITVVDATGTAYQDQDYNNVCYTAATVDGKQQWTPDKDVTLSGESATLYAYYPWTDGVDVSAIPVDMTEADQTDWMYATPVEGLNDANATAQVKLHHALANVKLTLYKESYSGAGEVTAFSVQSDGAATGGTLNAKTGAFTATVNDGQAITRAIAYTLTDKASATPFDCMVVPTGEEAAMTVTVTVDGHTYSSTTDAFTLAKATAYNLALKLTSTGLSVTSVSLTDWCEEPLPDADFEPQLDDIYALLVNVDVNNGMEEGGEDLTGRSLAGASRAVNVEGFFNEEITSLKSLVAKMTVDGVVTEPASTLPLEAGPHEIKIWFTTPNRVPARLFYNSVIENVTFPEGITEIGDEAFFDTKLENLYIPKQISHIGKRAFALNDQLESIEVDAENPHYDSRNDCNALMHTATDAILASSDATFIPDDTKIIDDYAFYMKSYTGFEMAIPQGVTHIGERAFMWCYALTSQVIVPNTCVSIGSHAFARTGITDLTLGSGLKTIGDEAFMNCEYLTSAITFPNTMESIGASAFAYTNITGLDLGTSVKTIGQSAFEGCNDITGTLTIPNSVKTIGKNAFHYCRGVTNLDLGTSVEVIEQQAFSEMERLYSGLQELVIPASVRFIGERAFEQSSTVTSPLLAAIKVDGGNAVYDSREDCNAIIEKATDILVMGCSNTQVPESVKGIGNYAFANCRDITAISIPDAVKTIGTSAFESCSSLASHLFDMAVVTIGSGLQSIGEYAFYDCYDLASITVNAVTAPVLNYKAFYNADKNGTLNVPAGCTDKYSEWMGSSHLGGLGWTIQEQ